MQRAVDDVEIISSQTAQGPGGKPYTSYRLRCKGPAGVWELDKRYSDFRVLEHLLKEAHGKSALTG